MGALEFLGRVGLVIALLVVVLAMVDYLMATKAYKAMCDWLDGCMRSTGLD